MQARLSGTLNIMKQFSESALAKSQEIWTLKRQVDRIDSSINK
jgi:hypothetical protein